MGRERQRSNEDRFRERKKTLPLPQDSAHGQQVNSKSCFLSGLLFNKDTSQQKRHHLVCEVNHPWGKNSRDKSWLPLLRSTWARLSPLASPYFHKQIRKEDARLLPWSVVPSPWPG